MRKLSDLSPKMPCRTLCRHPLGRFHWSCLYCRIRRFFYGKMDQKKYHYNRYMGVVINNRQPAPYIIFIDPDRKLAAVKDKLLKKVLTLAEMLAN
jgi:hypothetical protein